MSQETFESLEQLATNDTEIRLTSTYITSEKLKDWLTKTKEGKAISERLMVLHERAIDSFVSCTVGDTDRINNAKMDIEVSKRIYEVFNSIFQDGDIAEKQLSGELEQ